MRVRERGGHHPRASAFSRASRIQAEEPLSAWLIGGRIVGDRGALAHAQASLVGLSPDAAHIGIDLAIAVGADAAARAVAQRLRAIHRAGHARLRQNAVAAHAAVEKEALDARLQRRDRAFEAGEADARKDRRGARRSPLRSACRGAPSAPAWRTLQVLIRGLRRGGGHLPRGSNAEGVRARSRRAFAPVMLGQQPPGGGCRIPSPAARRRRPLPFPDRRRTGSAGRAATRRDRRRRSSRRRASPPRRWRG